jgi:hypothetical protein
MKRWMHTQANRQVLKCLVAFIIRWLFVCLSSRKSDGQLVMKYTFHLSDGQLVMRYTFH